MLVGTSLPRRPAPSVRDCPAAASGCAADAAGAAGAAGDAEAAALAGDAEAAALAVRTPEPRPLRADAGAAAGVPAWAATNAADGPPRIAPAGFTSPMCPVSASQRVAGPGDGAQVLEAARDRHDAVEPRLAGDDLRRRRHAAAVGREVDASSTRRTRSAMRLATNGCCVTRRRCLPAEGEPGPEGREWRPRSPGTAGTATTARRPAPSAGGRAGSARRGTGAASPGAGGDESVSAT